MTMDRFVKYIFIWLICFFLPLAAAGESISPIRVDVVPKDVASKSIRIPFHYFSGQKIELPLIIHGLPQTTVDLEAKFYHVTTSTAAQVGETLTLFADKRIDSGGILQETFSTVLPEIKRESTLQLQFLAKSGSQEKWFPAGKIIMKVYPDNLLDPMREWAKDLELRVEDRAGKLKQFLDSQKIAYMESQAVSLRDLIQPKVVLKTTSFNEEEIAREPFPEEKEVVVYFTEMHSDLPLIFVDRKENYGVKIIVRMKLIDDFNIDPRAQITFLDIIALIRNAQKEHEHDIEKAKGEKNDKPY